MSKADPRYAGAVPTHMNSRQLLAVDIEGYGARTPRMQRQAQTDLRHAMEAAATEAGLGRGQWLWEISGDGALAALPRDVDMDTVIGRFVPALERALATLRKDAGEDHRLRMRLALHCGPVIMGPFGLAGDASEVAKRLHRAGPLHRYLATHPERNVALLVSDMSTSDMSTLALEDFSPVVSTVEGTVYASHIYDPDPTGEQDADLYRRVLEQEQRNPPGYDVEAELDRLTDWMRTAQRSRSTAQPASPEQTAMNDAASRTRTDADPPVSGKPGAAALAGLPAFGVTLRGRPFWTLGDWRRYSVISAMPDEPREQLLRLGRLQQIDRGETLTTQGDTKCREVFVLLQGIVEVVTTTSGGDTVLLAICEGGDLIGEWAVLDEQPTSAAVVAVQRCVVRRIGQDDFLTFLTDNPEASAALTRSVSARLRDATRHRVDHAASVQVRVARLLLLLGQEHGETRAADTVIRLARADLARLIGISEPGLQRELRRLRQHEVIDMGYRKIRIRDWSALHEIARAAEIPSEY